MRLARWRGNARAIVLAAIGLVAAVSAGALALAEPLVAKWEGLVNDPYRDVVGVWTVCYGETRVPMRRYSTEECRVMLRKSLARHAGEADRCMPAWTPDPARAAFYSFAYNFGTPTFCGSGVARALRSGDLKLACRRLTTHDNGKPAWSFVKGGRNPDGSWRYRFLRGLANRREDERALCERGLAA